MKHLLSLKDLNIDELTEILDLADSLKKTRGTAKAPKPLDGKSVAMIFSKSSTRTRVSFEVGIHELGGNPMFFDKGALQLGRGEPIEDTAKEFELAPACAFPSGKPWPRGSGEIAALPRPRATGSPCPGAWRPA